VGVGVDGKVRVMDRGVEMGSRYVYQLENAGGTLIHETVGVYVPVARAALGQNYPNPFNPVTRIEYWVAEGLGSGKTPVSLVIYDVRGARVRTLVSEAQVAGRYVVEWNGRDDRGTPASSGVYFYRMTTSSFSDVRKMVLIK
jgi:flagellar hook assembly protein FlgD